MSQKERNEWIERAKERVLRNAKETDTYARDIMDLYDETANQLENEINAMFQKYAQDNKLDNAEAEKLLSGEEYSRWRKSMDKYVAEAQTEFQDAAGVKYAVCQVQDQQKRAASFADLSADDKPGRGYRNKADRSSWRYV